MKSRISDSDTADGRAAVNAINGAYGRFESAYRKAAVTGELPCVHDSLLDLTMTVMQNKCAVAHAGAWVSVDATGYLIWHGVVKRANAGFPPLDREFQVAFDSVVKDVVDGWPAASAALERVRYGIGAAQEKAATTAQSPATGEAESSMARQAAGAVQITGAHVEGNLVVQTGHGTIGSVKTQLVPDEPTPRPVGRPARRLVGGIAICGGLIALFLLPLTQKAGPWAFWNQNLPAQVFGGIISGIVLLGVGPFFTTPKKRE